MSERGQADSLLEVVPYALWVCGVATPRGTTAIVVTWVSQLSFTPALVGISLENGGAFLAALLASGSFTLSVLPRDGGKEVAKRVLKAGAEPEEPSHASMFERRDGWAEVPAGALGALYCSVVAKHECGDHTLVIGEVIREERWAGGSPLHLSDTGWKYRKPGPDSSTPTPKN